MKRPRVSVIIPVFDEESALPFVLAELPRDLVDDIVVVDNGSTDRSAEVARANGARVVHEPRRGYGWTVEMQVPARHCGLRAREVPARYRQRIGGSKISGTLGSTILASYKILRTITWYRVRMPRGCDRVPPSAPAPQPSIRPSTRSNA